MRWLRWGGIALGVAALLVLALWVGRFTLAESALRHQLAALGIEIGTISIEKLGLDHTVVGDISVAGDHDAAIGRIEAFYRPWQLLAGRVDRVTLHDVAVTLDLNAGSTQRLLAGDDRTGPAENGPLPPLPAIVLDNVTVEVRSDYPILRLRVDGSVDPSSAAEGPKRVEAKLAYQIQSDLGELSGRLDGQGDGTGPLSGVLTVEQGQLATNHISIGDLTALSNFELDGTALTTLDVEITLAEVLIEAEAGIPALQGAARLQGFADRENLHASVTFQSDGGGIAADSHLAVNGYVTEPAIKLTTAVTAAASPDLHSALAAVGLANLAPDGGKARLDLLLEGTPGRPLVELLRQDDPIDPQSVLRDGTFISDIEISAQNIAKSDLLSGLTGNIKMKVAAEKGGVTGQAAPNSGLQVDALAPDWLVSQGLSRNMAALLAPGLSVSLLDGENGPNVLAWTPRDDSGKADWALDAQAVLSGGGEAQVSTTGSAQLSSDFALTQVAESNTRLVIEDLELTSGAIKRLEVSGQAAGPLGKLASELAVDGAFARLNAGGAVLSDVDIDLPLSVSMDAVSTDEVHRTVALRAPGQISVAGVLAPKEVTLEQALVLRLLQGQVRLPAGPNAPSRLVLDDLRLALPESRLSYRQPDGTAENMRVSLGELRLGGQVSGPGAYQGQVQLADGRLDLPDRNISLSGLAGAVALGPSLTGRIGDFTIATIDLGDTPALLAPLGLTGTIARAADGFDISAEGQGPAGAEHLSLNAVLDATGQAATGYLDFGPVTYAPSGLQPKTLFPLLSPLKKVDGTALLRADFAWAEGRDLKSTGRLSLQDLSFSANDIPVRQINLDLPLTDLLALASPPGQRLTIAQINPGLALRDIDLVFQILPGPLPRLALAKGTFSLIGATFLVEKTLIDPNGPKNDLAVDVRDLHLGPLFDLIEAEGLSGSGTLEGRIPLVFDGGDLILEESVLAAIAPGYLRFKSEEARQLLAGSGDEVELLLQALEDFQYQDLTIRMEKSAQHDVLAKLSILGNNPEVLDGQAFRLNINLETNIGSFLAAFQKGYRISYEAFRRAWRLRQ